MSASATVLAYRGEPKDTAEHFHGNHLLYLGWDRHLMFCAPVCVPLPPDTPFSVLTEQVLPAAYAQHPDFARIDWNRVEWLLDGQPFTPDPARTLAEQGIGHKSLLRLRTPGLDGLGGSAS
ncbi:phenol hydroxylase subunit P4 [Plasticicumulans acidivorans]|uniref:Phenol 2-monooxygenase P4 subunit n=1 Tax=Plasticicumulans acidivorans TaxID=886464 RepID=A0A317MT14_9GAMM|nr:phenol hydroxylase subunit P4 [Plasticicumulans acidivorans]PWV59862.1 phenol 2-monooxygenase P4 subunit [Plasticicumulans acidivorans]